MEMNTNAATSAKKASSDKKKRVTKSRFPQIDRSVFFGTIKSDEDPLMLQRKMRDEK
ncbi:hypothetical protein EMGBS15_03930 [Filimonas sp.]|nr:hypothetical protein EMGBS15_03930 [Filimonas sp.]